MLPSLSAIVTALFLSHFKFLKAALVFKEYPFGRSQTAIFMLILYVLPDSHAGL